jgi:hypothetical protein
VHGVLFESIYMVQPPAFVYLDFTHHVLRSSVRESQKRTILYHWILVFTSLVLIMMKHSLWVSSLKPFYRYYILLSNMVGVSDRLMCKMSFLCMVFFLSLSIWFNYWTLFILIFLIMSLNWKRPFMSKNKLLILGFCG